MIGKQTARGFILAVLGAFSVAFLSGCSHVEPTTVGMFVADILRNVTAALLL